MGRSQRHLLHEQGATSAGETLAEGEIAPGLVILAAEGADVRTEMEVPRYGPGGPLTGSPVMGAPPVDLVGDIDGGGGGGTDPDLPEFAIVSILPDEFPAGYPDTGGTVAGIGFEDGAVIVFGGVDQITDFISATQLNFTLPSSTSAVGPLQVAVRNPGGETTGEVTFTFTVPAADDNQV